MPSRMFSLEGGALYLQMLMEMCISIAGLWQHVHRWPGMEKAAEKEGQQAWSKGNQMQFFLSKAQKIPASSSYPQNLHIAVDEVQAFCINPHRDMTGERSWLPALQIHPENAPKHLSACVDTWWGTQTHRHKALANFVGCIQTGEMQGSQTLSSLQLELRPNPKSTKSLFTGSRC